MFRPIYKLSSPHLSLSLTHSTTLTLTVLFFHAFFLIVRCFVHSEIWTPKKKKISSTKNSIAAFRVVHYPTRPKPLHRRSDPDFAPPKCRWPNLLLLLLLLLHRSRAFQFLFLILAPMAMRSVDFKWLVPSSYFSVHACVSEFESMRVIGFGSLKWKICGFFFPGTMGFSCRCWRRVCIL